jgi:2-hydroxy-6-oxonona-2,4-dienedioate hydrolase
MNRPTRQIVDGLDKSKLHFIDVDGVSTRYYDDGEGEPLILFSGGQFGFPFIYSLDHWSLNLSGLAPNFRVIALDKLGQGHTANPLSNEDYTFDAVVYHAYRFIKALGLEKVSIAGHSRGALLVARLALDHPKLVKKLVLVDTSTLSPETSMFPSLDWYNRLPSPDGPPSRENVQTEVWNQAYNKGTVTESLVDRLLEIAQLPTFQEGIDRMTEVGPTVYAPNIDKLRRETVKDIDERGFSMPTMLVWGYNDRSAPLPLGQRLFEHLVEKTPETEMHVLNHAGHNSYREQPEAFNRLVRGFCLE